MAVELPNLPELIEDGAARYGIAPLKLWGWAFNAIAKDVLRPNLPEGQSLDTEYSHGGMPLTLRKIINARRAMERYDPSNDNWAKSLEFDPAEFDKWLRNELLAQRIPVHPKRPVGRKKTKREALAAFIDKNYPHGVPAGVPVKTILPDIESKVGFRVTERTFRRALGRA